MSYPSIEYGVDCVMCPKSFSATTDTLNELVQLARVHVHDMKKSEDKNHKPGRGGYPETKDEILRSKWFAWTVSGINPYTKLKEACRQIPLDEDSDAIARKNLRRRRQKTRKEILA
jgi:hypothetical protein